MSRESIDFSMLGIFRTEAESQTQALTASLLELEQDPAATDALEACMRAAHSLKGASRIVGISVGVQVAHVMEDCFVAAQQGLPPLNRERIDLMLRGVDLLTRLAQTPETEMAQWTGKRAEVDVFVAEVNRALEKRELPAPADKPPAKEKIDLDGASAPATAHETSARVLRVTADNLNRLLALAGESVVESSRLKPFSNALLRLKRSHHELAKLLDDLAPGSSGDRTELVRIEAKQRVAECRRLLEERLTDLDTLDRRAAHLARRLYDEALAIRMRPFSDGIQGFHRLVRDLGHSLGKEVKLQVVGEGTQIDRDIQEQLKAPLNHLLRNAVDHGVESPPARRAAGKPPEAVVRLEARHSAGLLQINVSDDGHGIDLERLRLAIVTRKLANEETSRTLSESELLEFLFLPGFTMKEQVTEVSGRGVGLDVVRNMVQQVRGSVRIATRRGEGSRFQLQLPLTLSVIRSLLVEIAGEPYAFPLAHVIRTMKVPKDKIEWLEGRPHAAFDERRIGLVAARQVLGGDAIESKEEELSVIVVGNHEAVYGLVVDRFLGERELVVQPFDGRLSKIKDIAAGALMEDGAPVLIVDTEDIIRSVAKLVSSGRPENLRRAAVDSDHKKNKRILVVDDSLTVRELERKLLTNWGYEVEVAVDGMEGWNAMRGGNFDLVVSDIDMPRLDGIELVKLIKKDQALKGIPVMIISYKDREEDRRRGLDAGADYYLAKASFHDDSLLQAVVDLIGEAH
jgi:two-component system, chemotaxis family, sensor histidine kinase and response regulator WspE